STSGARGTLRTCTLRMRSRPTMSGFDTTIWRSKRPGRKSAGSSTSGRFVAAIRIMLSLASKPSISTRSWFKVCSRSSLPPPSPAPRRLPTASISSMKMMQGEFFLACSNMSRTRLAPTPTNISTKSEPEIVKKGTLASPAMARARRADQQNAARDTPAKLLEPLRITQEFDDFLEVFLGLVDAGDVFKRHPPMRLGQELCLGFAKSHGFAPGPLHLPRQKDPNPDDGDQRQPVDEQRHQPIGAFRRRLGRDGHILFIEALDQRRVVWGIGRKGPVVGEMAGDLIARDRNLADMALINLVQELAEGDVLRRHPLARVLKQHHKRNDEQDYDHPKHKIPEIRIHLRSRHTSFRP